MVQQKLVVGLIVVMATVLGKARADTAIAADSANIHYWASATTLKEARTGVLSYCKRESERGNCRIISQSKPASGGYAAVATSKLKWGAVTGYGSQQDANTAALQSCASVTSTEDVCNVVMSFYDSSRDVAHPVAKVARKSATSNLVSHSDSCYNGDCIRTFDNGKKVRFQAPYCYDVLSGKWDWKPGGC